MRISESRKTFSSFSARRRVFAISILGRLSWKDHLAEKANSHCLSLSFLNTLPLYPSRHSFFLSIDPPLLLHRHSRPPPSPSPALPSAFSSTGALLPFSRPSHLSSGILKSSSRSALSFFRRYC